MVDIQVQLDELDRQVERGSLFTQATLQRGFRRIGDAEELLVSLVRALTARGLVSEDELGVAVSAADTVQEPLTEVEDDAGPVTHAINWPTIALRVDDAGAGDTPEVLVDCEARMPVCRAVCCKLKFPLSADEVDDGVVKWDIGHPYIIRQESDGFCTHNDTSTGGCGVYAGRPAVCRRYSCAGDTRIWKDFDAMVLNQEWIDEHLGRRDLHVAAVLPSMEELAHP
jgi:Fe-S-cluster containining protein